jgi:hypothetical protein
MLRTLAGNHSITSHQAQAELKGTSTSWQQWRRQYSNDRSAAMQVLTGLEFV